MAIQVGTNPAHDTTHTITQQKVHGQSGASISIQSLSEEYPGVSFLTEPTQQGNGADADAILYSVSIPASLFSQMESNPEKRVEIEALIQDCVNAMKKSVRDLAGRGIEVTSCGTDLDDDGNPTMHSFVKTGDNTARKFSVSLPKNNKNNWPAILNDYHEKMIETLDAKNASADAQDDMLSFLGSTFSKSV